MRFGTPNPEFVLRGTDLGSLGIRNTDLGDLRLGKKTSTQLLGSGKTTYRITESFGSEGIPRGHLVQPPHSEQGHR